MPEEILQPKISEIRIKSKNAKDKNVFCETFVYQPENIGEMKLGSLFFVGRIQGSADPSHILNLITSLIKREYYSNPKRKSLTSLEAGLKKANFAIADLAKTGKIDWLDKISFICVSQANDTLHLTQVGQTKILLLRSGRLTDIGRGLVPAQDKANPQKMFQSVASGKLFPGDKVILTTADLFKYISQNGLKQVLEYETPKQLEKILSENKDFSSQGLITFQLTAEKTPFVEAPESISMAPSPALPDLPPGDNKKIKKPYSERAKNTSSEINLRLQNYLFKAKDKTKQLAKRIKSAVRERYARSPAPSALLEKIKNARNTPIESKDISPATNSNEAGKQKIVSPLQDETEKETAKPVISPQLIRDIAIKPKEEMIAQKPDVAISEKTAEQPKENQTAKPIFSFLERIQPVIVNSLRWFFGLPFFDWRKGKFIINKTFYTRYKHLLIITPLSLFLLIGIGYLYSKEYQKRAIYYQSVSEKTDEELRELNKIDTLVEAPLLVELTNSDGKFNPKHIFVIKDNVLAISDNSTYISFTPLQEASASKFIVTSLPEGKTWRKAEVLSEDTIILLDDQNNLYRYDFPENKITPIDYQTGSANLSIADFTLYNNYIYLLGKDNSQIIKCALSGLCSSWLKDNTDISKADSLAIDGSIYALQNGQIETLFAGSHKETLKPDIKPALNHGQIRTSFDFNNFYILNKEHGRIIIVNKKGELVKQFTSEEFSDLKDLYVSNDEKTIYILNGYKIFKIDLAIE